MKKYGKIVILIIVLLSTGVAIWYYLSTYSSQSRASQDVVSITIDKDKLPQSIGDEAEVPIQIQGSKGISAFTVKIKLSEGLEGVRFGENIETVPSDAESGFSKIFNVVDEDRMSAKASYVSISLLDDELPSVVSVPLVVQKTAETPGSITILEQDSQITGSSGVQYRVETNTTQQDNLSQSETDYEENITDETTNSVQQGSKPEGFEDLSFEESAEPIAPEDVAMTLAIAARFQGVQDQSSPSGSLEVLISASSQEGSSTPQIVAFSYQGSGLWIGSVPLDVKPGSDYVVYMKGAKHLQKKICDINPLEDEEGTYTCEQGNIELQVGENELDFSDIILLAGDITGLNDQQDGLIDANDLAFVRNNIGTEDQSVIERGDINMDGVIDTQDYSLITATLSQAGRNADDQ